MYRAITPHVCWDSAKEKKKETKGFGSPCRLSKPRPVVGVVCWGGLSLLYIHWLSQQRLLNPQQQQQQQRSSPFLCTVLHPGRHGPGRADVRAPRPPRVCALAVRSAGPEAARPRCTTATRRLLLLRPHRLRRHRVRSRLETCAAAERRERERERGRGPHGRDSRGPIFQDIVATEGGFLRPPSWRVTLRLGVWTKSTCPLWGWDDGGAFS